MTKAGDFIYVSGTIGEDVAVESLSPGTHRIEVRAQGYEPLTFDVRITPADPLKDAATGAPVWQYTTSGADYGTPTVVNGKLYVGTESGKGDKD